MLDILLFLINGGAWALKPILEKLSVDSIGYFDFVFIRYFFCGVIALFVLVFNYLSGKKFISLPRKRRLAKNGRFIEISGATGNNLKSVNLKIPVGTFTCITGVSGSGKSTLILHTLYNAFNLMLNKNKSRKVPKPFKGFKGNELIDR